MVNSVHGLTDKNINVDFSWEPNAAITTPEQLFGGGPVIFLGATQIAPRRPGTHWQAPIIAKIRQLLKLPENWNSYGAPRLRYDTAMFAILVLEDIMNAGTPLPSVVPSVHGGIQLEWHENDIDFEVDVVEPYRCEYTYYDERNPNNETSGVLDNDFRALQIPVGELTRRADEAIFRLRTA